MNEPFNAIGTVSTPPFERARGGVLDALVKLVLGPNEDDLLPLFTPYMPRLNLLAAPKPPSWLLLGGLSLLISALVIGAVSVGLTMFSQRMDGDIQQIKQLTTVRRAAEQNYKSLQHQVDAIDAQKGAFEFVAGGSPRWADILDKLRGLMPSDVRIERLEGTPDGALYLKGKAASLKTIGSFMLNLRGSGFFYEPQLGMGNREKPDAPVDFDLQVKVAHGEWLVNPEFAGSRQGHAPLTAKATP